MTRCARRAFTLLEVLVCVGMLVLLVAALGMFLEDLASTRMHAARATAQTRSADALFGAIESALQTAVVDGGGMGAGVQGGGSRLRVLSSRTDAGAGSVRQLARSAFAPLSATEVEQSGGTLTVRRGGASSALPAGVRVLSVRFLGAEGWSDQFDSLEAGALPRAVEVSLWFGAAAGADGGTRTASRAGSAGAVKGGPGTEPDAAYEEGGRDSELLDVAALGPPDRVRVFAVPDAAGPAAGADAPAKSAAAGGAP